MGLVATLKRSLASDRTDRRSINDPSVSITDALADDAIKSAAGESVSRPRLFLSLPCTRPSA